MAVKRIKEYVIDFTFSGLLGLVLLLAGNWLFVPTSFYFQYESVDYVGQQGDVLRFVSNINYNNTSGDFHWNDVLRCNYDMNPDGFFEYISQWDTSVKTSEIEKQPFQAPFAYRGKLPEKTALCRLDSTITRHVNIFIPKEQFVQTEPFVVKI